MRGWADRLLRGRGILALALLVFVSLIVVFSARDVGVIEASLDVAGFDAPSASIPHDGETERAREPRTPDVFALRRSATTDPGRWTRSDGGPIGFAARGLVWTSVPWTFARVPRRAAERHAGRDAFARSMVHLN